MTMITIPASVLSLACEGMCEQHGPRPKAEDEYKEWRRTGDPPLPPEVEFTLLFEVKSDLSNQIQLPAGNLHPKLVCLDTWGVTGSQPVALHALFTCDNKRIWVSLLLLEKQGPEVHAALSEPEVLHGQSWHVLYHEALSQHSLSRDRVLEFAHEHGLDTDRLFPALLAAGYLCAMMS